MQIHNLLLDMQIHNFSNLIKENITKIELRLFIKRKEVRCADKRKCTIALFKVAFALMRYY